MQITAGEKDRVARELAEAHAEIDPGVIRIIRIRADHEDDEREPIKLLEVNTDTVADGIVPVGFGPGEGIPYPSDVVDVTPDEFRRIESGQLLLPNGWRLDEILFERES